MHWYGLGVTGLDYHRCVLSSRNFRGLCELQIFTCDVAVTWFKCGRATAFAKTWYVIVRRED